MLAVFVSASALPGPPTSLQPEDFAAERWLTLEKGVRAGQQKGWDRINHCTQKDVLNVSFMLRHTEAQATNLRELLLNVSDPRSAQYGHYLSRSQLTSLVAVPKAVTAVHNYLTSAGVESSSIVASATQDAVSIRNLPCPLAEKLFSTDIHHYEHATHKGRRLLRAARAYSLPQSIAAHVRVVAPLLRLPTFRRPEVVRVPTAPRTVSKASKGSDGVWNPTEGVWSDYDIANQSKHKAYEYLGYSWPNDCGSACYGSPSSRYTTPGVLRELYNLPEEDAKNGSMAIASFQGEFWNQDGLDAYTTECGLPRVEVASQVGPQHPGVCTSEWGKELGLCVESMMDVELIKATGGSVPLTVVYNAEYSLEQWALELGEMEDGELPLVHSVSYGDDEIMQDDDAAEGQSGDDYMDAVDAEFVKLGLRGVTILVAAGDQGVWGRSGVQNGDAFHADYPAASPWVTAVGGTDLKVAHVLDAEQAWSAGGGGFSGRAAMPEYQKSAVESYLQSDAVPTMSRDKFDATMRAYPDVSALGGVQNPFCLINNPNDGWIAVGGTSASSPVVAGMVARLNSLRIEEGKPSLGFLNPFLYQNPDAFNDVVWGENKDAGFAGFRAAPGWDAATGLGTPDFEKLAAAALRAA